MGFFKSILKTAKDIYKADSNNQLGDYIFSKVGNVVNKLDGTEEDQWQQEHEAQWEAIKESFGSDDVDNETFQSMVDNWIDNEPLLACEQMVAYYYKASRWEMEYDNLFEYRKESSSNLSDEESKKLNNMIKNANEETLTNVNAAINFLDDDTEDWICTLFNQKSRCLHNKGEHMEAVRTAILGLSYAQNDDEKQEAKWQISGKQHAQGEDFLIEYAGYGIEGRTKEELLASCMNIDSFIPNQNSSMEENINMLEFYGEFVPLNVMDIINGKGTFSNFPYHDRQFIFTVRDLDHIGGCYDDTDTIKYVFAIDELPRNISFPVGHPQPNTLYYAHPLRPVYLPFEKAQIQLFHERIQEMCRLFQCLGATQIIARCLKGEKISQSVISSYDVHAEGGYKLVNGSFTSSGKVSHISDNNSRSEMFLEQTFSPKRYPYCPDDLIWVLNDPEIQTFIHQRLEGSLLSFSKRVSSFETSNLSQNRINDVQGAFQSLMANVSANYSTSTDSTFSSVNETEWELNVQFKPLDEFDNSTLPQDTIKLPEKERLVMSVEKFCPIGENGALGIGIIGTLMKDVKKGNKVIVGDEQSVFNSEIKEVNVSLKMTGEGKAGDEHVILFLDGVTLANIRQGMNIYLDNTETSSVQEPSDVLTSQEEKYKEEILFCMEDGGDITQEDRKYLERKRIKWGISEERAKEIESQVVPSLTDNEKEYIETYKEMCENGNISERIRRLLDRERESLGISKERANKLEKMVH